MNTEDYIRQWNEVKAMTEGKTMDEIRAMFGSQITNEFEEEWCGHTYVTIDANYKDICVTFENCKDGSTMLDPRFESYDEEGMWDGIIDAKSGNYTAY